MFAFLEKRKPETAATMPGLSLHETVRYAVDALDEVIFYLDVCRFYPVKEGAFLAVESRTGKYCICTIRSGIVSVYCCIFNLMQYE